MGRPEELEFRGLLFGGILIMLLLAVSLIIFFVIYQKKLITQQMHMQQIQNNYQRQMLASSIDAQEKRERIGYDLHDQIGSSLSTVKLLLNQIVLQQQDKDGKHLVANIKEILSSTVQDVRNIAHDLYPSVLAKFGLTDALQNLVYVLSEATSLEVDFTADDIPSLPKQHELALYRMVQELSSNTLKHARATKLSISLHQEPATIRLIVQDNGTGFDYQALSENRNAGIGLKSVEARASMIGAGILVNSEKEKGTRVEINLPL